MCAEKLLQVCGNYCVMILLVGFERFKMYCSSLCRFSIEFLSFLLSLGSVLWQSVLV